MISAGAYPACTINASALYIKKKKKKKCVKYKKDWSINKIDICSTTIVTYPPERFPTDKAFGSARLRGAQRPWRPYVYLFRPSTRVSSSVRRTWTRSLLCFRNFTVLSGRYALVFGAVRSVRIRLSVCAVLVGRRTAVVVVVVVVDVVCVYMCFVIVN